MTVSPPSLPLRRQVAPLLALNYGSTRLPSVVGHRIPQRQEWIDVHVGPMHARTLRPVFDHEFVGALDHAAANRPALRPEAWEGTAYAAWDDRIIKTADTRAQLLAVLQHPDIPLHHNDMELAARCRVRKRDVRFCPPIPGRGTRLG